MWTIEICTLQHRSVVRDIAPSLSVVLFELVQPTSSKSCIIIGVDVVACEQD